MRPTPNSPTILLILALGATTATGGHASGSIPHPGDHSATRTATREFHHGLLEKQSREFLLDFAEHAFLAALRWSETGSDSYAETGGPFGPRPDDAAEPVLREARPSVANAPVVRGGGTTERSGESERERWLNLLAGALQRRGAEAPSSGQPRKHSVAERTSARSIRGRVLDFEGLPLAGAILELRGTDRALVGLAVTDESGVYRGDGLALDAVSIVARGPGLFAERTVSLVSGSTARADFRGAPTGSVSGTVTDEGSGMTLEGYSVYARSTSGGFLGAGRTDSAGAYRIDGLVEGEVVVHTIGNASSIHVDEVFDDVTCIGGSCASRVLGERISVVAGAVTESIDFALAQGGRIVGTVTDQATGSPIEGTAVLIFDAAFDGVTAFPYVPGDGTYQTKVLPPGDYLVQAWHRSANYVPEIYDDVPCLWNRCDMAAGTWIQVGADAEARVDITMRPGARIDGTVKVSGTDIGISGSVRLRDVGGVIYDYRTYGSEGQYSIPGLPAGTYYLTTWNQEGFFDELYQDIRFFPLDDVTAGTPISLELEDEFVANFELEGAGTVTGSLRLETSGEPLAWEYFDLVDGARRVSGRSNGDGNFVVTQLEPASYVLATKVTDPSILDEYWDDVECRPGSCDPAAATPIVITADETISGIDIALLRGGTIRGRVLDRTTAQPVEGAVVYAYIERAISATTAADGTYEIVGLHAGEYAVFVEHPNYYRHRYGDVYCSFGSPMPCRGVAPTVHVGVEETVEDIDFSLAVGGRVFGTVTEVPAAGRGVGAPVVAILALYDAAGYHLEGAVSEADGTYSIPPVPTGGSYFLSTTLTLGHLRETYRNQPALFFPGQDPAPMVSLGEPIRFPGLPSYRADLQLDTASTVKTLHLEVQVVEEGAGGVVSDQYENCADACSFESRPSDAVLRLEAFPTPGSELERWAGDPDCEDGQVTLSEDRSCIGVFRLERGVFVDGFESGTTAAWNGAMP